MEANNKILTHKPIETLKPNKKYEFAIYFTNDPYYGKINTLNEKYVIRGKEKKSSNSFYSYVSLYMINNNERFTISVLPVEKGKSKVYYLTYFIDVIKSLNFGIKTLCLDREFYSIDVFELLKNLNIPYITPVVKKGDRIRNQVKPNTSTKSATIRYFYALISFLLKNIKEDLFRFDVFLLLIEDWIRRKLKMKMTVECLR